MLAAGQLPIVIAIGSHEWRIHAGRGGRRSGATAAGALSMRWAEADGRKAASRSSVVCVSRLLYSAQRVCDGLWVCVWRVNGRYTWVKLKDRISIRR